MKPGIRAFSSESLPHTRCGAETGSRRQQARAPFRFDRNGKGSSVWPALVIAMAFVASVGPARAQDSPARSITVVVPFPAGGASDVVARIVTSQMSGILGQSIIIENVSGAGGTIGSARVAAAAPDGHTLLAAAMGSHGGAPGVAAERDDGHLA